MGIELDGNRNDGCSLIVRFRTPRDKGIIHCRPRPAFAGVIQLVECQLPKLDVVGSSPIARSVAVQENHL